MNFEQVKAFTEELLIIHNLGDWSVAQDNAKRRAGLCSFKKKQISFSKYFIEGATTEQIMDTVLHEIAHAIVGCEHGHDNVWKAKCVELGGKPDRCYGEEVAKFMPKGKHIYYCPTCDEETYQHRKSKRNYACGHCCNKYNGGKYTKKYEVIYRGKNE